MRFLFAHQNFPGQYKHLVSALAADPGNQVVFLTQRPNQEIPNIKRVVYKPKRKTSQSTHPYARGIESAVINAEGAYRAALALKKGGFKPDILIGHNAWGETLYLKEVFPEAPLLSYFEFYFGNAGSHLRFDPEYPDSAGQVLKEQTINCVNLLGLNTSDWGQTPTLWQQRQYPSWAQEKITVVHDGIDTGTLKPDAEAFVRLRQGGRKLTGEDEIITYVARSLEPFRGFHIFMRALPEILSRRPNAIAVVVGADDVSYGHRLPPGESYRKKLLAELKGRLDATRVHFVGQIPYELYARVLQVSSVHVYLTYPFVLSWSMLEAMAAGCLVVASRTSPVQEVIRDQENGFLVDFFSPEALAESVVSALACRDQLQGVRANARKTVVDGFDLRGSCLPRQIALVESLVNRTKTA